MWIWIPISLNKFVPKGPINNIPALFKTMACCLPGNKLPTRQQAIIWTKHGLGYQRIYASLRLNELIL